jgi:hypothetical protein
MIGEPEEEGTQEANREEEPTWPTLASKVYSTASLAAKKDTMPKIAPNVREKGEWEPRLTLSTLIQKKTHYTKEAKPKKVEWP